MATRSHTQRTPSGRRSNSRAGGRAPRSASRSGSRKGVRRAGASRSKAAPRRKATQRPYSSAGEEEMEFTEVGVSASPTSGRMAVGEVEQQQVDELLLQAIETEIGGIEVYETAIRCAQDEELRDEWTKYLEQTRNHERILADVFRQRGLDLDQESPGRQAVRYLGESLVQAMEMALQQASPKAAQLLAAECVVLAETKDHANWELIGEVAKALGDDDFAPVLKDAHDEVEDEEDEHLYHTMGWARELWLQSLGLPAVIPPPEEEKGVRTAIGAAKAKAGRKRMLKVSGR
jgi:hypothetical protein